MAGLIQQPECWDNATEYSDQYSSCTVLATVDALMAVRLTYCFSLSIAEIK